MARTNLAYQHQEQRRQYDAEPIPSPRPRFRTIEGQGKGFKPQAHQVPWTRTLVVMSALVMVVLATVSVARVGIANATVQMLSTAEQTSAAIDQARATGLELEIQHSLANNPTRIQDAAASLGILPSQQPATLDARSGFAPETIALMQQSAEEARAAELAVLQPAEDSGNPEDESTAPASETDSQTPQEPVTTGEEQ